MNVKNFLSIYAIIILLYGILFLFLPNQAYEIYGSVSQKTALATNILQGLGGVFISAGVMAWLARNASASHGRRAILAFIALGNLIFLIRGIMAMAGGNVTNMSYVDLIVQLVFAAGAIYFLSKEKGFD